MTTNEMRTREKAAKALIELQSLESSQSEKSEPDAMIEEWANNYYEETYHEPELIRFMQYGCFIGAKAYRDGKIGPQKK